MSKKKKLYNEFAMKITEKDIMHDIFNDQKFHKFTIMFEINIMMKPFTLIMTLL